MGINVGIIGCGSIAKNRHAPEYGANPYVNEIVFYDRNPERAEALAKQFNGRAAYSLEDLLEDPSVEAISVCSSNENHEKDTVSALLSGKHVLCEKPLSLEVDEARNMIRTRDETGKKLMIAHNQRFTKAHQEAKEIISSGKLGKVLTFRTTFGHGGPESWGINKTNSTWFFKKDRSGLGVAGDLGVHKIDLIHYLLDDQITDVSSFMGALHKKDESDKPIEVCDNIVCSLKTRKGVIGTGSFSWTYYGEEDNSTILYCEKGILKIYHDPDYQLELISHAGEKIRYEIEGIQTNENQSASGVIDAFLESLQHDEHVPVTGEDGLLSLQVILAIIKAAETNTVVEVN